MAVSAKSLGIDKLQIEERIALVEEIWDGIFAEGKPIPLTPEIERELDRRIAEHDANPDDVVSLEGVMASVRQDLNR